MGSVPGSGVVRSNGYRALHSATIDVADLRRDGDGYFEATLLLERRDEIACVRRWVGGNPRGSLATALQVHAPTTGCGLVTLFWLHAQADVDAHSGVELATADHDSLLAWIQVLRLGHDHSLPVLPGHPLARSVRVCSRCHQGKREHECTDESQGTPSDSHSEEKVGNPHADDAKHPVDMFPTVYRKNGSRRWAILKPCPVLVSPS